MPTPRKLGTLWRRRGFAVWPDVGRSTRRPYRIRTAAQLPREASRRWRPRSQQLPQHNHLAEVVGVMRCHVDERFADGVMRKRRKLDRGADWSCDVFFRHSCKLLEPVEETGPHGRPGIRIYSRPALGSGRYDRRRLPHAARVEPILPERKVGHDFGNGMRGARNMTLRVRGAKTFECLLRWQVIDRRRKKLANVHNQKNLAYLRAVACLICQRGRQRGCATGSADLALFADPRSCRRRARQGPVAPSLASHVGRSTRSYAAGRRRDELRPCTLKSLRHESASPRFPATHVLPATRHPSSSATRPTPASAETLRGRHSGRSCRARLRFRASDCISPRARRGRWSRS